MSAWLSADYTAVSRWPGLSAQWHHLAMYLPNRMPSTTRMYIEAGTWYVHDVAVEMSPHCAYDVRLTCHDTR